METQFDIKALLDKGRIENELELERAMIADRKLKHLSKDDAKYKTIRRQLRDLIEAYENHNWSEVSEISDSQIKDGNAAESIAEKERIFIQQRKEIIKRKLKSLDLTQQQLGFILGHTSKSYMSELVNGVSPFQLKDLIIIHKLLKIALSDLIPTILPEKELFKVNSSISELNNDKLKFPQGDLEHA